ncbi:LOW QUALITY PROTEIN: uncharacterized protein LOC108596286 [Drosophila busckii]|uniref:LOW QUALITY PROTEIN: uncharacterized protein LOC108596286 n=1 Tax=Drosophila busckii TaxID=30019 RepID=UPI001432B79F|nr:LOW QUALITY PROTEIN: uncharacterized protein LOC108596286 [Drosophila busckii]
MEHESQAQAPTQAPTPSHPLQDVPLAEEQQQQQTPKNWVKFDDEATATDGSENNNNEGNATQSTSQSQSQQQQNKLMLPPPPPSVVSSNNNRRARSRSPAATTTTTTPEPAQRAAVSSTTSAAGATLTDVTPAVLTTESTHVNLNASGSGSTPSRSHPQQLINQKASAANAAAATTSSASTAAAAAAATSTQPNGNNTTARASALRWIQPPACALLNCQRVVYVRVLLNGDVIVTLLPANTKWPWITPAIFRPELVPEELMAQGLTLTVEDYVNAMETLVNDYRFTVYNICYKRILVCWILFAFTVLLALLFSGLQGVALFSLGVGWLFLNAAAIFLCMWVKLRLSRGLEKCLARVNKQLMRHKILLVLDDRGRISCHKVNLCFMYFDSTQCVSFLNEFLEHTEQNGGEAIKAGWEAKLDIDVNDIVIQGSQPVRLSRKQAVAQELFLSYLQRWGKDFLRRRLDWTVQEAGVHETPRHLQSSICPCQYEEELLRNKIKISLQHRQCCGINCINCWL